MRTSILATVLSISLIGAIPVHAQNATPHVHFAPKGESLEQAVERAENDLAYCDHARFKMGLAKIEAKYQLYQCVDSRIKQNDRSKPEPWKESVQDAHRLCSELTEKRRQAAVSAQIAALGKVNASYTIYGSMSTFSACMYEELK